MLWIILALILFIVQIAAVVIFEFSRPYKAVTWMVILFLCPPMGFLLYFFVGKEYACKRLMNREDRMLLEQIKEQLSDRCGCETKKERRPDVKPKDRVHAMLENAAAIPVTAGNETTVYAEGTQAFEDMLKEIAMAKRHIHITSYIIRNDQLGLRFQQLLIRKAREGVKVRLLYDGIGCLRLRKSYINRLKEAGVEIECFFPLLLSLFNRHINFRNHRKIIIVDGKIGYFGGLNIGDEYVGKDSKLGYWRDTHFRIEGNAVLWIQYTFLIDWFLVKGEFLTDPEYYPAQEKKGNDRVQIVKSGPDETSMLELIFSCVVSAKKRIYIETPYFIPDPGILFALKTAAISKVDVRIILPAVPDHPIVYWASLSYVKELLQSGVRFYFYEKGFIHAKVVIADDLACSGSANMDIRSFCGQFELGAVFFNGGVVDRLVRDFVRDLSVSKEILLAQFESRSNFQKCKETFARLLSPLF
ncbi:cardiolipin synthase [Paenibacillus ehimensis]|uniref:Cardiolipin synthase n=1 Tax=Paenibacillus ehimensis TaxID=79264 RepID=A0ABT8VFF4_9BACL|nr:cardiolipin synthase [Paenibacillus ehimensis]MDO3679707.1 cardiolipin synthase [Paenibacillus ehimensis]